MGRRGTDLLWGGLMRARHGDFVWLEHSGVLCVRRPLRRRSGGLIEFELAIQAGRGGAMGGALSGRPTAMRNARMAAGCARAAITFM